MQDTLFQTVIKLAYKLEENPVSFLAFFIKFLIPNYPRDENQNLYVSLSLIVYNDQWVWQVCLVYSTKINTFPRVIY